MKDARGKERTVDSDEVFGRTKTYRECLQDEAGILDHRIAARTKEIASAKAAVKNGKRGHGGGHDVDALELDLAIAKRRRGEVDAEIKRVDEAG